jgi:hypothetical protein
MSHVVTTELTCEITIRVISHDDGPPVPRNSAIPQNLNFFLQNPVVLTTLD